MRGHPSPPIASDDSKRRESAPTEPCAPSLALCRLVRSLARQLAREAFEMNSQSHHSGANTEKADHADR